MAALKKELYKHKLPCCINCLNTLLSFFLWDSYSILDNVTFYSTKQDLYVITTSFCLQASFYLHFMYWSVSLFNASNPNDGRGWDGCHYSLCPVDQYDND